VDEKTHGKIKEILPVGVNPDTRVILTNALYFKAEWQISFIEGATMPKKFYPLGREFVDNFLMTDMMAHGGKFSACISQMVI
jgi:serpin B